MGDYIIFWERMANSGIIKCRASSAEEAAKCYGFNPEYVRMTVVKVTEPIFETGKRN